MGRRECFEGRDILSRVCFQGGMSLSIGVCGVGELSLRVNLENVGEWGW